jgi:hypothetical protein
MMKNAERNTLRTHLNNPMTAQAVAAALYELGVNVYGVSVDEAVERIAAAGMIRKATGLCNVAAGMQKALCELHEQGRAQRAAENQEAADRWTRHLLHREVGGIPRTGK